MPINQKLLKLIEEAGMDPKKRGVCITWIEKELKTNPDFVDFIRGKKMPAVGRISAALLQRINLYVQQATWDKNIPRLDCLRISDGAVQRLYDEEQGAAKDLQYPLKGISYIQNRTLKSLAEGIPSPAMRTEPGSGYDKDIQNMRSEFVNEAFKGNYAHRSKHFKKHKKEALSDAEKDWTKLLLGSRSIGYSIHRVVELPVCDRHATVLYIDEIFVRKDFRKRSNGVSLLKANEETAKNRGLDFLVVDVPLKLEGAFRFYERNGFEEDYALDGGFVRMAKDLRTK